MLTAINLHETKPYISRLDKDQNKPTKFYIGVIDAIVDTYITDKTQVLRDDSSDPAAMPQVQIEMGMANLLRVKFGIKNIEDLADPVTGQMVIFKTDTIKIGSSEYQVVADEVLAKLPFPKLLIPELSAEILKANGLNEGEQKN
ncbi:MAG: hypothetical protein HZB36_02475 [Candidatus Omnitrophica bacterium]|nr:hypothetical protein [Candidatus Omnitrophota bacterium]